MSWSIKIKNFLGIDFMKDYWWLGSKTYAKPWFTDQEVNETCTLRGKSKCNLLLNENVRLSIDNEFEGLVIGKKDSAVRVNSRFSGVISCDFLLCGPNAKIDGDVFVNKMVIREGIIFNVSTRMGMLIQDSIPLQLSDIKGLSPRAFMKKYQVIIR